MLVGTVLQLPFLYVLEIGPPLTWYLIPTQGHLLLMLAGSEPLETWQWTYAITISILSVGVAGWWARRRFQQFVALQEG